MTNELRFEVPGVPVPLARARSGAGHHYTPTDSDHYMQRVGWCALAAAAKQGWTVPDKNTPLAIEVHVFRAALRGDASNFLKGIEDGITKCKRVWHDDRQLLKAHVEMELDRDNPHAIVWVRKLEGVIDAAKVKGPAKGRQR
jgi:Holliday junction resolvase RusA-like endonuclease